MLTSLGASSNQLLALPASLGDLTHLQKLWIDNNNLQALPWTMMSLRNLRELYVHGNQALDIPEKLLGPSWEDVKLGFRSPAKPASLLEYYFRTRTRPTRPLNEAKLILVGRGEVGKTSLVTRLVRGTFNPNERKTEGIQITKWPVMLGGNESVLIHVWDFGGQEIMHATHQFFLTDRSLYLLVLNGREGGEDADVEYWLRSIKSFGGDSPVIIVLNKFLSHPFAINKRGLEEKFPGRIRAVIPTDCESPFGLQDLRDTILREVGALPDLRTPFPESWFEIKERLGIASDNYITFERYQQICSELGEGKPESQENLAEILHRLGIALNYKDDPRLSDTHILNPHWVTNGIYTILNSPHVAKQNGEVSLSDLGRILDPRTYPTKMHEFLLGLMKKFELCFRFPDPRDQSFLVPQLLGKEQPEEVASFSLTQCLNFQYEYPVWPEGLLPRFVVRTHALSKNHPRWRTGVILEFEGNLALVRGDVLEKRVVVSVAGPADSRRRLLAVIRSDFERIHADFPNLEPVTRVPIPDHPPATLSYSDLLVFERNGRQDIEIAVADRLVKVDVRRMLDSIDLPTNRTGTRPVRLFISYSHKDDDLRSELDTHLKLFQREGLIQGWHDRRILPSQEWKKELDEHLQDAEILLLLVSADFLASDYCYEIEMRRAMERHEKGLTRVLPIIVRDCVWHLAPFGQLQALPSDGRAVREWPRPDPAWRNVAEGLQKIVQELRR
jgi:internalin A